MPVRRDLGSIDTPEAHYERRSFGVWIASDWRKIASLNQWRPLQIAEMHNFWGRGCSALFFLLAVNSRRDHRKPDQRCADASRSIDFHKRSEEHTSELQSQSNLVCRL